jgi:aspartyl-tRNA(Asn)/glutamyl-tRNA(Gln) amidotransferase subunit C
MKLSREEVQRIALLARLGISEDEIEKFQTQLSNILENFEVLNQVDTTNLLPTTQSINLQNIFRSDETQASYPREDILFNAPQQENSYFKVKAIFEE